MAANPPHRATPDGLSVVPSVIAGRYRLTGLLGSGGMADVYAAQDERLDRLVAIKLFRPGTGLPRQGSREQSEISLLARLNHPNLVMVLDAGICLPDPPRAPAEQTYLVMEFVNGRTLAAELAQGALPAAVVAQIGKQLAAALGYIHAAGVVHRDVKPANVLISAATHGSDAEVSVKLGDFGIARMLDDTRLTVDGTIGTANYLSPEQAAGAEVGPASDIYSVALVLLEALTGHMVYPGGGIAAVGARLYRDPEIPATIPMAWATLLRQMLDRDPAQRPTAAEVGTRLRELSVMSHGDVAAGNTMLLPGPATTAMPHPPATRIDRAVGRSPMSRRRGWLAAGAGLIVLIALIATVSALSNSGGQPQSAPPTRSGRPTHAPISHARTSRPTRTVNPTPRPQRPANTAQAITALRAAVAHAVRTGNLDIGAAADLDKELADLSESITSTKHVQDEDQEHAPKIDEAKHKVDELVHHLDDLSRAGQLSGSGRRQLGAALAVLEHFIPAQQ